jgi:hypothetical protein
VREDRELEVVRLPTEQFPDARELRIRQTQGAMKRLLDDSRQRISV